MADIILAQGDSLPPGTKITYKDMGDGTYALVLSADVAAASLCVPAADSADNATVMDVVGNKLDTLLSGNSLMAYAKLNASNHIASGTSPNSGGTTNTATRIELDSSASAVDGAYDPAAIYIVSGTGAGQARQIWQYVGATKLAYVNRDWKVVPDDTSVYCVVMDRGDSHVNEGLAQGGAASAITLNALASAQNSLYLGQMVFIAAGTGADQARMCVGYNGGTKVLTVDSPWIIQPDNTSIYAMYPYPGFVYGVPTADSAVNILIRDVVGNKLDTTGGDSLVSLVKALDDFAVPTADSTDNVDWGDVVGNKEDAASQTADVASLIALLRASLVNTNKIDAAATDGLSGISNSLAYRAAEIERHFHNRGRFWGAVAVPDETNAIEANVTRPFVAVSGADAYGTAIPICGTADDPVDGMGVKHDAHRLLVVDTDHSTVYRMRIIYGTGTSAAAITAKQWSEEMFITAGGPFSTGTPIDFLMRREDIGIKLWVQVWNATNSSEVDFFWGTHPYEG